MAGLLVRTLFAIVLIGVAHAGDIEGTIVVTRKLTKRKVTAPAPAYQRGVSVELREEVVDDPISFERARVVVYIDEALPTKPVTALLEQKFRRFTPDVLVVPVGSTVSFPNLDPIFHNVFSLSGPKSFDLGNYAKDQTRTVTFPKPGVVFVHCHLHPNMAAAIVVSPNQWSVKAGADGRFVLRDVPPGRHKVVAWHKAAGTFTQTVTVGESSSATVEFVIPLNVAGAEKVIAER